MRPRPLFIVLASFSTSALLFAACGHETESTATSTTGSTATSASGTGGAPNCEGTYLVLGADGGHPCDVCMREQCCAEMAACREYSCVLCANDSTGSGCGPESRIAEDCANAKCLSTCTPDWHHSTSSTGTTGG